VSERTNRNAPARNTLAKLLALCNNPKSHNAQHYRQAYRQMDDRMMPTVDHAV